MSELPGFLREALDDAESDALDQAGAGALRASEALETLSDWSGLLGSDLDTQHQLETQRLWARLDAEVGELPLRYAPFFDDLGELFGLDETALSRELSRAKGSEGWSRTPFRGVRLFRVRGGNALGASEAYLVSLTETASIPRHRHPGVEKTFVLEGGYREDSGREFHAGDSVVESASRNFHSLQVIGNEPCVIALQLERRFVFESPFYRAFLNIFWR